MVTATQSPESCRSWKRDAALVAVLAVASFFLILLKTGYEGRQPGPEVIRSRAEVLSADNSDVQQFGVIRQGEQRVTLRVLSGPLRGESATASNTLVGDMQLDYVYRPGDVALVTLSPGEEGIRWANIEGPYRLRAELLLCVLFAALLIGVAGWTGLKALLSFAFAILMIWKVLIPCFLQQYDPVPVALGVVAVLTAVICFLVGGLTRRGLIAFLGGFLGLLLTCCLALVFSAYFHLSGAVQPFAKALLQVVSPEMDINRIFLAGIFVAASGAVMDLAMDIASAQRELIAKHPEMGAVELMRSGLSVGRAVIGTMTTTLLLAYSGAYVTLMMYFMAQGVPLLNMLNTSYISAEILNTLVGSFGLVTVAPFTALVGGLIYTRGQTRQAAPVEAQGTVQPGN